VFDRGMILLRIEDGIMSLKIIFETTAIATEIGISTQTPIIMMAQNTMFKSHQHLKHLMIPTPTVT
jgi:hypothetical protein